MLLANSCLYLRHGWNGLARRGEGAQWTAHWTPFFSQARPFHPRLRCITTWRRKMLTLAALCFWVLLRKPKKHVSVLRRSDVLCLKPEIRLFTLQTLTQIALSKGPLGRRCERDVCQRVDEESSRFGSLSWFCGSDASDYSLTVATSDR